ncbi:MAG TPA: O-antigen polymerase [Candidatus Binatia bacterium]|nr:O-antigen polymerase [Candidatus Binatia bacterium]
MSDLLLLLVAVALPCWYVRKRCISGGWVRIDHVATFTFGYLFYWITPLAVRSSASRLKFPLSDTWLSLFRERLVAPYALSCLALYACFALGDSVAVRLCGRRTATASRRVPRLALSMVMTAACLLLVCTAYVFRSALFRPAQPGDLAAQAARGAVTTCVVLLGVVCLIFTLDRPEMSWKRRLCSRYFLSFIAGCLLLLWSGSRLYVASFLVMFAVYRSSFRRPFRLRTAIAAGLVLAVLFGAIGMWREGSPLSGSMFNVLEEPMLNSLSLVYHLRHHGIAWINFPGQLARDFLNLAPSLLVPHKFLALKKLPVYMPLGGLNSFVSFNLNFGLLGSAVFLFFWPVLFRSLLSRSYSTLAATMYIMCSGWLAFTFFRDPFSVSLVKAIVQDSIVMPAMVVALGWLLSEACPPLPELGVVPEPPVEAH